MVRVRQHKPQQTIGQNKILSYTWTRSIQDENEKQ